MSTERLAAAAAPGRRFSDAPGFTLIEILVVLLLCLGIVAIITQVYRATGKTLQSLGGAEKEWYLQQDLRQQAHALLLDPQNPALKVEGHPQQLYLPTWQSRRTGRDGKPVLARYTLDQGARTLAYQEIPLPAWWSPDKTRLDTRYLAQDMPVAADTILLRGLEDGQFSYLENAETFTEAGNWTGTWEKDSPPQLIKLVFARGGRHYEFWLDLRTQGG